MSALRPGSARRDGSSAPSGARLDKLSANEGGGRPLWVVTLPPSITGAAVRAFVEHARDRGADVLEVRTDLHAEGTIELSAIDEVLPVLVAERGVAIPASWAATASILDRELPAPVEHVQPLWSHHAAAPLPPGDALELWVRSNPSPEVLIKHVEPVGTPEQGLRLLETQRLLGERFGAHRVTVLAMGPLALPFRALLSTRNALEYVALGAEWMAAPGQRSIDDARRSAGAAGPRLGILGSGIPSSRSPRLHRQPFDRLDLPADSELAPLVHALHPHYRGFAVTSPFKQQAAKLTGSALEAINTLVRSAHGWEGYNTDVNGAEAVLARLSRREVTVLGDGGATAALRIAAGRTGTRLRVVRQADIVEPVRGPCIWTWSPQVVPPATVRFVNAQVVVIAYGPPAQAIAALIRSRGGTPRRLGPHWFIAQARAQRRLWEDAA